MSDEAKNGKAKFLLMNGVLSAQIAANMFNIDLDNLREYVKNAEACDPDSPITRFNKMLIPWLEEFRATFKSVDEFMR